MWQWKQNNTYSKIFGPKGVFFRRCDVSVKSPKEIFQITILNPEQFFWRIKAKTKKCFWDFPTFTNELLCVFLPLFVPFFRINHGFSKIVNVEQIIQLQNFQFSQMVTSKRSHLSNWFDHILNHIFIPDNFQIWMVLAFPGTLNLQTHITQRSEVPLLFIFKNFFQIKCFIYWNWSETSNFIPEWLYLVVKVSKRAKKSWKKPQFGVIPGFSEIFFGLANLIHINSYKMRKKLWCHYISLEVIFSRLVFLKHHFRIYSQQLSTTS